VIPYVTIPPLSLGALHLAPFSLLVAAGIVVTYLAIVFRANNTGIDPKIASDLCVWMLIFAIPGAVLFKYAYTYHQPELAAGAGCHYMGISSFGGIGGGLVGAAAFFFWRRIASKERWQYMNLAASRFPIGLAFGRAGCALAHDHPGIRSSNWLAVRYPGGARYDLGLLELMFLILVVGAFLALGGRKPSVPYLGLFLIPYGLFRLGIDRLHENPPAYLGITVDQYASLCALLLGCWVILRHTAAEAKRTAAESRLAFPRGARSGEDHP